MPAITSLVCPEIMQPSSSPLMADERSRFGARLEERRHRRERSLFSIFLSHETDLLLVHEVRHGSIENSLEPLIENQPIQYSRSPFFYPRNTSTEPLSARFSREPSYSDPDFPLRERATHMVPMGLEKGTD